ncbi:MAG: fimbrillin family protein [Bacteroides sp.]|nr:fimbrillin family protein [Bacteroides sp.]
MKKHSNSFAALVVVLATLFSCTGELEKEELPIAMNDEVRELQAFIPSFEVGDAETRLDMNVEGNSIALTWSEEDRIGVFPNQGDQVSFAMSEGAGGSTATFSGGGWALKNNAIYYAYYPFNRECYAGEEMKNQVPCSFEGQMQTRANSLKHLGKYAYMYSSGSTPAEGKVMLKLQHLTTLLKLDLTSPISAPATVKNVTLEVQGYEKAFCLEGAIDLTKGTLTPTKTSSSITLACAGDIQLTASGTSVYLVLPPTDLSGRLVHVSVKTEEHGVMNAVFVPSQGWKAGSFYTKQLIPKVPTVSINCNVKLVGVNDNIGAYGVKYYDLTYTATVRDMGTSPSSCYFHIKDTRLGQPEINGVKEEEYIAEESESEKWGDLISHDAYEKKFTYTLEKMEIPNSWPDTRSGGVCYTIWTTYIRTITTLAVIKINNEQELISAETSNQWTWLDYFFYEDMTEEPAEPFDPDF